MSDNDRWNYNIGVPQGLSCGPILWLLIANEALKMFDDSRENLIQAFADHFVILLKSSASFHFKDLSRRFLENFERWTTKFNLSFSLNKCCFLMFKARKEITHIPPLYLNNRRIQNVKTLKYLGLLFDENLSFIEHLNSTQEKIVSFYPKLKRLIRATWGLNPLLSK